MTDLVNAPERGDEASVGTDDPEQHDFMNLRPERTGVDGFIYVSTREGAHGPRVKVYAGRPGPSQPSLSISIAKNPRRLEPSNPPRELLRIEKATLAWVEQNADLLRKFWDSDGYWLEDEVDALRESLKPLSR